MARKRSLPQRFVDRMEEYAARSPRPVIFMGFMGVLLVGSCTALLVQENADSQRLAAAQDMASNQYACLEGTAYDVTSPDAQARIISDTINGEPIISILPRDKSEPYLDFVISEANHLRFADHVTAWRLVMLGCQDSSLHNGT